MAKLCDSTIVIEGHAECKCILEEGHSIEGGPSRHLSIGYGRGHGVEGEINYRTSFTIEWG